MLAWQEAQEREHKIREFVMVALERYWQQYQRGLITSREYAQQVEGCVLEAEIRVG